MRRSKNRSLITTGLEGKIGGKHKRRKPRLSPKHLERLVAKRTANLRESEERFRSVADYAAEAIITINAHRTIVFWNKAAKNIFGYSPKEAIGKPITIIIPKQPRKKHQEAMNRLISDEKTNHRGKKRAEFVGLRKNGSEFPLELSFSTWKTKKTTFFTGVMRDITERKKAEQALQSSEAKFRALFENVPVGIYQSTPEGKIITANPTIVHMLGYDSLAELVAVDIARDLYVSAEDRQVWKKKLEEKGEIRNAELILQRKDGQRLIALENAHAIFDEQGEISYYEGTLVDITEIKMLEERLSALNHYSGKMNAANDLQQIYELTLDALEKMLGFENATFMVAERGRLREVCQRGYPEPWLDLPLDGTKKGLTVKAVKTREVVLVHDVRKDKEYVKANPRVRSEVVVPVEIEGRVLGVLDVESKEVGAFSEKDVMLLQILASHVATAISNLEKRKEIEKRSNELALLMKSSAEMIRSTDLHKRLQKIAESIREHGWRRVVIRAVTEGSLETLDPKDMVTAGLTDEEREFLWNNRVLLDKYGVNALDQNIDATKLGRSITFHGVIHGSENDSHRAQFQVTLNLKKWLTGTQTICSTSRFAWLMDES